MRLSPVYRENHEFVEVDERKIPMANFLEYEGILLDEPNDSKVSGAIIDGSFVGTIRSKRSGLYHVEPAVRFDKSLGHSKSVVYHENDVEIDPEVVRKKRDTTDSGLTCAAAKESINKRVTEIQKSAVRFNLRFLVDFFGIYLGFIPI